MNVLSNNECGCAVGIQGHVLHARKENVKCYNQIMMGTCKCGRHDSFFKKAVL
jgi:hypothetical protein